MTYNKGYYNANKIRISQYNKARRENNPEIILKEKESYQSKAEDYKLRSKIQHLKGKMAWEIFQCLYNPQKLVIGLCRLLHPQ